MALYKWEKYNVAYRSTGGQIETLNGYPISGAHTFYYTNSLPSIGSDGRFGPFPFTHTFDTHTTGLKTISYISPSGEYCDVVYHGTDTFNSVVNHVPNAAGGLSLSGPFAKYTVEKVRGTSTGKYVYSTAEGTYPSDGEANGIWYVAEGTIPTPTLTAPAIVMAGLPFALVWNKPNSLYASFKLYRSVDGGEFEEVYSGENLTYTDTAGNWKTVSYRLGGIISDGTLFPSFYTVTLKVVPASALVISGQDGELGTLVNDVPYTVSTDTGRPITIKVAANGAVILDGTISGGSAEYIPVLDLVNGDGTIVIEASVETDSGPVSVVRTWTYHKAPITFPNAGSPAQMTKDGKNIWPKTLAECVRMPGGRTLDEVMGFPCQIFVGRYTGTGTYGSGDPNEVTIPFKPQAVFVTSGSVGTTIPMIRPCTSAKNSSATLTVTWEDDSVSWYSTSAANQLNANGTTYDVVAFG